MGYYTKYELTIEPESPEIWEAIEKNENLLYAVGYDGEGGNECKWYYHEDDMVEFSKKFPEVLFRLYGEGEESGDMWCKYFKNGKKQKCVAQIIFPKMNEEAWI